jgi:protein tyrosine phosphatase
VRLLTCSPHTYRDKNRYGNALPNPETRVVLKGGDTDYINANYIQGEQTQYIAAQVLILAIFFFPA